MTQQRTQPKSLTTEQRSTSSGSRARIASKPAARLRASRDEGAQHPGTAPLLALQQTAGNDAVVGLLERYTVGAANDPAEAQADRAADAAMEETFGYEVRRSPRRGAAPTGGSLDGGPLDEATSAKLAARRGRGATLPGGLARAFGSALGADLSGVRVHDDPGADALASSLSATAFTVGRDVFFSKGAYRPDDAGGRHLLAHELAHVAQGSGTVQRQVVRRAVGFEYETNLFVKKKDPESGKMLPLAKMEKIHHYGEGVSMEADEHSTYGSAIEFVIEHVEEKNRPRMVKALKRLQGVLKDLAAVPHPGGDTAALAVDPPVPLSSATSVKRKDVYFVPQGRALSGNPQATGGISIDKVFTMMQQIGKNSALAGKHAQGAAALEKMSPDRPSNMAQKAAQIQGSDALKGLVATLVSYLDFGRGTQPLNYAKLISNSTLIRTDFGTWFSMLPGDDKKRFLDDGRGQSFVDLVLSTAGLADKGDQPVFERGVRKSQDKSSPDYNVLLDDKDLMISRQNWLLAITRGWDPLSSFWMPQLKGELEGLGRLGPKTDKVGKEVGKDSPGTGIIMEFRNMAQAVFYDQFPDLALQIFDYIVALNAR